MSDIFLTKIDPAGAILFTSTYGGTGADSAQAIAIDPAGNIYIAGTTSSSDFPLTRPLQSQTSGSSGFIVKLASDAKTILYSTYFGGTQGSTSLGAIATDSQGNLYVTGWSRAADFPQTSGLPRVALNGQGTSIQHGAVLAELSAAGDRIIYSAVLSALDSRSIENINAGGAAIAVDSSGRAYVAVNTYSENLAPFVAKVAAGGNTIEASFPQPQGILRAVALDASGSIYFAADRFIAPLGASVTKLSSAAESVWHVELPPSCSATAQSLALDSSGHAWASGALGQSCALPNMSKWSNGTEYLVEINPATSAFDSSALYPVGTVAQSIGFDKAGLLRATGFNGFVSAMNVAAPASMKVFVLQNGLGGVATSRVSPAEVISIYGPNIGPSDAVTATPTNGFLPTTLGGVQATINGQKLPLLYVSANQINAIVPMNVQSDASAALTVTNGVTMTASYPLWIAGSAPIASAAVLNQDGTRNSDANPARAGSVITFFATGWQSNLAPLADGQIATAADNHVCASGCTITAQIPGIGIFIPPVDIPSTIEYAGPSPGTVAAVTQFNIRLGSLTMFQQASRQGAIVTLNGAAGQSIRVAFAVIADR